MYEQVGILLFSFEFIVSQSYFKLHLARIFTLVTICFLVMDNQDNLYATSDLRPLTPHLQGSAVKVDPGSSSEIQPDFLHTHSSLDLLNVRRDLKELTGLR